MFLDACSIKLHTSLMSNQTTWYPYTLLVDFISSLFFVPDMLVRNWNLDSAEKFIALLQLWKSFLYWNPRKFAKIKLLFVVKLITLLQSLAVLFVSSVVKMFGLNHLKFRRKYELYWMKLLVENFYGLSLLEKCYMTLPISIESSLSQRKRWFTGNKVNREEVLLLSKHSILRVVFGQKLTAHISWISRVTKEMSTAVFTQR